MEKNKIILIAIAVLVIALIAVGGYLITSNHNESVNDIAVGNNTTGVNKTKAPVMLKYDNNTNKTNDTVVGDNSPRNDTNTTTNKTYRIYNPQTDSYVTVIGESYDVEVDRWYTYDTDGVRYYNTRVNHS